MEINVENLTSDPASAELIECLRTSQADLHLSNAQLYYDFPLYKDEDGNSIATSILLVSVRHGVVAIQASNVTDRDDILPEITTTDTELGKVFSALYARLIRQKALQHTRTQLKFPVSATIFLPNIDDLPEDLDTEFEIIHDLGHLQDSLNELLIDELSAETFGELISVIEGVPPSQTVDNSAHSILT